MILYFITMYICCLAIVVPIYYLDYGLKGVGAGIFFVTILFVILIKCSRGD
jgi:hypothetical protein